LEKDWKIGGIFLKNFQSSAFILMTYVQELPHPGDILDQKNKAFYGGSMKSKSALFVSAALTAFILVTVTSVVSVVKSKAIPVETVAQAEPTQLVPTQLVTEEPQAVNVVATTQPATISAEMAATIAAQVLGKQDISGVTGELLNGVLVYKVTFSTGEIVYISLQGQVLSVTQAQTAPTYNVSASSGTEEQSRESAGHAENEGGDD
jgi:hypothetical protein